MSDCHYEHSTGMDKSSIQGKTTDLRCTHVDKITKMDIISILIPLQENGWLSILFGH